MRYVVFGRIGSDAGYWSFEHGHWVHHEGWGIDQLAEVTHAINILTETARLKTPGLADAASKQLSEFVQQELGRHLGDQAKGGTTVIVLNNVAR
jgi:transcription elongation factor GreA-like protein